MYDIYDIQEYEIIEKEKYKEDRDKWNRACEIADYCED